MKVQEFKPGDRVYFTSPFGVVFDAKVVGVEGEKLLVSINKDHVRAIAAKECRKKKIRIVGRSRLVAR